MNTESKISKQSPKIGEKNKKTSATQANKLA